MKRKTILLMLVSFGATTSSLSASKGPFSKFLASCVNKVTFMHPGIKKHLCLLTMFGAGFGITKACLQLKKSDKK
jgi:hypothetical protein